MGKFSQMKLVKLFTLCLLLISFHSYAQEEEEPKLEINGYIKDLVTFTFIEDVDSSLVDNLIHNRINLRWFPTQKLEGKLEIRNRIFSGDLVQSIPNYPELIDINNDYFDLSARTNGDKIVAHTMIDRASLKWSENDWQLTVGRQRINWGVNLAWNPNDVFNAYSLLDFDYTERPGSDAIRFQKYIGYAGGYEVAVKMADDWDDFVGAGLYKWNVGTYDLQVLGGFMKNNLVTGGAWAGNIGLTGFKGEFTYFNDLNTDDAGDILVSISSDYSFPNSLYFNGSVLYNSYADQAQGNTFINTSPANLDVRSISTTEWSAFLQSSYNFHPLITGSTMILFYPGESGVLLSPMITYSPMDNFDVNLIGQFIVDDGPNIYLSYLRVQYSF